MMQKLMRKLAAREKKEAQWKTLARMLPAGTTVCCAAVNGITFVMRTGN